MHKYRLVAKKGEGTFSEVLKAQCIKNGKYVAIKCMKNHFDSLDQVNNLREIQALRRLSPHPGVIKLLEVLYDQPTGRLALVFELMDMNVRLSLPPFSLFYHVMFTCSADLRAHPWTTALCCRGEDQELHVSADEINGPHASQWDLPPRHQA